MYSFYLNTFILFCQKIHNYATNPQGFPVLNLWTINRSNGSAGISQATEIRNINIAMSIFAHNHAQNRSQFRMPTVDDPGSPAFMPM